jgi:hypothetical protein
VSRTLSDTVARAAAGAREAREAAEAAREQLARARQAQRDAAATLQKTLDDRRSFAQSVLAAAWGAQEDASKSIDALETQAATNRVTLAAMSKDATLGVLVNALVEEADAVGLALAQAFYTDNDWSLQFRDAGDRLFTLVAAKKGELDVLRMDNRVAIVVGESPETPGACSLTVAQLMNRLRGRGITVSSETTEPVPADATVRRAEAERAR